MIYEIRVTPFDVMIINRIANMTSVDCDTQLVDEWWVKKGKADPLLTKRYINRRKNCHPRKQFTKTIF